MRDRVVGRRGTSCHHEDLHADVSVTRVLNRGEEDQGGEVCSYVADVRVNCAECGEPFGWRSVECGISLNGRPMRSADGLELRAWLISPSEIALLDGPAGLVGP